MTTDFVTRADQLETSGTPLRRFWGTFHDYEIKIDSRQEGRYLVDLNFTHVEIVPYPDDHKEFPGETGSTTPYSYPVCKLNLRYNRSKSGGISDRATLLQKVINLIKDRFGFYHASVFLVDSTKEFATIKESTGEAGERMVEQNFKITVGSQSVIGHVTSSGESLIINDVTGDPMYKNNHLLPETQAESGNPMTIGTHLIGASNIKLTHP